MKKISYSLRALIPILISGGFASSATAVPQTLTFDNPFGPAASYTEKGMAITATAASTSLVSISPLGQWDVPCCPTLGFDEYDLTTGGLFDLLSIDIVHSDLGDPITFDGFLGAALVNTTLIDAANFGTLNFVGFTGLDRVRVTARGLFSDPRFDNLTYKPVPEPYVALLLATGLVGLAAVGRRRPPR
jgi:hypothetical protein